VIVPVNAPVVAPWPNTLTLASSSIATIARKRENLIKSSFGFGGGPPDADPLHVLAQFTSLGKSLKPRDLYHAPDIKKSFGVRSIEQRRAVC
jgi:hypothetical protein